MLMPMLCCLVHKCGGSSHHNSDVAQHCLNWRLPQQSAGRLSLPVQSLVLCYAIILNSTQSCQQLLSKHDAKPARRALLCHPDRAVPPTVLLPGASCRRTALHAAVGDNVLTRTCVALRAPSMTAATPGCCSTQRAATHEALTPCFSPTSCSTCTAQQARLSATG
jgi:hypothetical protein